MKGEAGAASTFSVLLQDKLERLPEIFLPASVR